MDGDGYSSGDEVYAGYLEANIYKYDIYDGNSFYAVSPLSSSDGWVTLDLTGDGRLDLVWTRDGPGFSAWGMPLNPHWRIYPAE